MLLVFIGFLSFLKRFIESLPGVGSGDFAARDDDAVELKTNSADVPSGRLV
jgi:hypothetical protein